METVELKAQERKEIGKKLKGLRKQGLIPAIVYGHDIENIPVSVNAKSYIKSISGEAGTNVIISLNVYDGKKEALPVITHEIQRNPLTDEIIHLDLHKINMKEKIQTHIPVELTGTSIGAKEEGGILVHSLTELEIKCLPMDIPDKIGIDVAALKVGDSLHVSDLRSKLSSDVEIITPETELVVQVVPPAKEEAAPVAAEAVAAEGEAAKEGEAPAEGEAASKAVKPEAAQKSPKKEGK